MGLATERVFLKNDSSVRSDACARIDETAASFSMTVTVENGDLNAENGMVMDFFSDGLIVNCSPLTEMRILSE